MASAGARAYIGGSGVFKGGRSGDRPPWSGKFFPLRVVAEPPVKRYLGGAVVRPPPTPRLA
jgi:hypothetical protein